MSTAPVHARLGAIGRGSAHTGVIRNGKGAGDGVPGGMTSAALQQIVVAERGELLRWLLRHARRFPVSNG